MKKKITATVLSQKEIAPRIFDMWIATDLAEQARFQQFRKVYAVALPFMVIMFFVRGILQALQTPLSTGANAAISGIAGISHILMTVALVLLFLALRRCTPKKA